MTSYFQYSDQARELIEKRFLDALRWHISGWRDKVTKDFSEDNFNNELQSLQRDDLYRQFGFAIGEYALVRLMGRISISIGRRLGEIYDKLPRFIASARFGLSIDDVVERLDGLELDLVLRNNKMPFEDRQHVAALIDKWFGVQTTRYGLAIEVRYNFNPNDSARLRKDVTLANLAVNTSLFPIYLIFSGISPRREAIARLGRAGWNFLSGADARQFLNELLGIDFIEVLERPVIRAEVEQEISYLMQAIFTSFAFREASKGYVGM